MVNDYKTNKCDFLHKMIHIVENNKIFTGPKENLPDQITFYLTQSDGPVNLGNTDLRSYDRSFLVRSLDCF